MKKENTAVTTAAYKKWLSNYPWAKHFQQMVNHLPADDADTLREMLRRDVWHSCRHRDTDITAEDIERSFKNLLDSHRLDVLENRYEMCKRIDEHKPAASRTCRTGTSSTRRRSGRSGREMQLSSNLSSTARRKTPRTRKSQSRICVEPPYLERDRVNGHLTTTPMPPSVKVVSKTL